MKTMKLEVITPQKHISYDNITYIVLPSLQGECGILPNHIDAIIALEQGTLSYSNANEKITTTINSGFAYVRENTVRILTDFIAL